MEEKEKENHFFHQRVVKRSRQLKISQERKIWLKLLRVEKIQDLIVSSVCYQNILKDP